MLGRASYFAISTNAAPVSRARSAGVRANKALGDPAAAQTVSCAPEVPIEKGQRRAYVTDWGHSADGYPGAGQHELWVSPLDLLPEQSRDLFLIDAIGA